MNRVVALASTAFPDWGIKNESARGLAQSKTLSRGSGAPNFRQVLDCASPLALFG
jgi:hypothetical protein